MNIAAYCRVSTDKEGQLNSLEAQKGLFSEDTKSSTGDVLVHLHAGITAAAIGLPRRHDCASPQLSKRRDQNLDASCFLGFLRHRRS